MLSNFFTLLLNPSSIQRRVVVLIQSSISILLMIFFSSCDVSFLFPEAESDEYVISGSLNFDSSPEGVSLERSQENGKTVISAYVEQGKEIVLASVWEDREYEDQMVTYAITPQSDVISINTTDGTIRISDTATPQDNGDYVITIFAVKPYSGTLSLVLRVSIVAEIIPITGTLAYTTENQSVQFSEPTEIPEIHYLLSFDSGTEVMLNSSWAEREDEEQVVSYTMEPANEHITIDKTTGDITISAETTADDVGDYTVTAEGVSPYSGQISTSIRILAPTFKSITGTLSFTTDDANTTITHTPDTPDIDYTVQFDEGTEIVIKSNWSDREDEEQAVSYTIESNKDIANGHITMDATTGDITIGADTTLSESGQYTVIVTGIAPYQGKIEQTLQISMRIGEFSYAEPISTTEGDAANSGSPQWKDSATPPGVEYSLTSTTGSVPAGLTVDKDTGIVYVDATLSYQDLNASGVYTVVAAVHGIQVTTTIQIILGNVCDTLDQTTVPTYDANLGAFVIRSWREIAYLSLDAPEATTTEPHLSSTYVLVNDIVLPHATCAQRSDNNDISFIPIGGEATGLFRGSFDGGGYTIEGLYIDDPSLDYAGLFKKLHGVNNDDILVKDLTLKDVYVNANAAAGALAGLIQRGVAKNIKAIGTGSIITDGTAQVGAVSSTQYAHAGGILGTVDDTSSLINSMSELTVTAQEKVAGGLVGYTQGLVTGYSTGDVTGKEYIGGLVGHARGEVHGYSTGNISGTQDIGGLVGYSTQIITGYSTGTISGISYVGGLVGRNIKEVTGYFVGNVIGKGNYKGGLTGNAYATVTGYATGDISGEVLVGGFAGRMSGANAQGYARGNIRRNGGASQETGRVLGGGGTSSADDTYFSQKSDGSESKYYDVDNNGALTPFDASASVFEKNETGVEVLSTTSLADLKTLFSNLDDFDGVGDIWELAEGTWPTIKLPELADIEGAKDLASEQLEFVRP